MAISDSWQKGIHGSFHSGMEATEFGEREFSGSAVISPRYLGLVTSLRMGMRINQNHWYNPGAFAATKLAVRQHLPPIA